MTDSLQHWETESAALGCMVGGHFSRDPHFSVFSPALQYILTSPSPVKTEAHVERLCWVRARDMEITRMPLWLQRNFSWRAPRRHTDPLQVAQPGVKNLLITGTEVRSEMQEMEAHFCVCVSIGTESCTLSSYKQFHWKLADCWSLEGGWGK